LSCNPPSKSIAVGCPNGSTDFLIRTAVPGESSVPAVAGPNQAKPVMSKPHVKKAARNARG
jgi:hypothetical protein